MAEVVVVIDLGITWNALGRLWIVPLVAVLLIVAAYQQRNAWKSLLHLAHPSRFRHLFRNISLPRIFSMSILYMLGIVFLCIAFLEPQWGSREEVSRQEGRDVMIALDISRSMLAADFKPSRLEHAKMKIQRLVQALDADRVGLILFSGDAFVQCPLTRDHAAFNMFLRVVSSETFGSGTTNIDQAIRKTLDSFMQHNLASTKLLILVTDGENFSLSQQELKSKAEQLGLRVLALGTGSVQGAPIPQYDAHGKHVGYVLDAKGNLVLSQLDEEYLKAKVADFRGIYVPSTYDDRDINVLAAYIYAQEKKEQEERSFVLREAQYPWFAALAAITLGVAWIL